VRRALSLLSVFSAFSALCASSALSAQVPTVALTRPDAEYAEPFTSLSGVRELRDGQVIAADYRDQTLQRIDLGKGTAQALSRQGSGPGEYAYPMQVYPLPGDSTLIYDLGNQRYLVLDPAGKPAGTFRMEEGGGGPGLFMMRAASAVDGKGRLYYQTRGERGRGDPDAGPPEFSDSAPVIRYDRATRKFDTLGVVKVPKPNVATSGGPNNRNVMMRPKPMAPEDAWGVALDGRVGVARVTTNQVEWWMPDGRKVTGTATPYTPIKFTEGDKKLWRDQMAQRGRITMSVENGRTTVAPAPRAPAGVDDDLEWPATKPPFPSNAVRITPEGELWLLRTRPASDPIPAYDVFNAQGRLIRRVTLPKDTRLVAFGKGTVYLARKDADDLEYLQRYRR
jgi:hypothetical protein